MAHMPKFQPAPEERAYREDTLDAYNRGVERAIAVMHQRLGDELTVDDLADAAFMSRHHFTRVFSKVTGVSPGRFLAAVRMQEAKRLLLQTDRSVTNVSLDVGYNSLGTFTRIFSDFVCLPPLRFRKLSRPLLQLTLDEVTRFLPPNRVHSSNASLCGEVVCASPLALVIVAMFPTAIPRSQPIECDCLTDSLRFSFSRTAPHDTHIFAAGLPPEATMEDAVLASHSRIQVGLRQLAECVPRNRLSLELRPRRVTEPPVVIAFPLLFAESLLVNRMSNLREETRLPQWYTPSTIHQSDFLGIVK